jgi:hypothetical protein
VATKKQTKTAKVNLDAATVHKFESALRDGLVSSGAVMMAHNTKPKLKGGAKVELDAATTARLSEVLRKGLVASHSVMSSDNDNLDEMTGKIKGERTHRPPKKSTKSKKSK